MDDDCVIVDDEDLLPNMIVIRKSFDDVPKEYTDIDPFILTPTNSSVNYYWSIIRNLYHYLL